MPLNAIVPPLSLCGPVVTIRKFGLRPFQPEDLVAMGSIPSQLMSYLGDRVRGRANIVVSGGTGSGKTTLLGVLSSFIPTEERLITIEDAAELRLAQPHVVSLEARPPNVEGVGEVTVRALVRNALRMRPDRIIVGEVRGGETLDMLQAMNTGHEGSMSTAHANSARDLLSRLETMALMSDVELPVSHVREQIASALDLIVHTGRRPDGGRGVVAVAAVEGARAGVIRTRTLYIRDRVEAGPPEVPPIPPMWGHRDDERGPHAALPARSTSDAAGRSDEVPRRRPARERRRGTSRRWPGSMRRLGAVLD